MVNQTILTGRVESFTKDLIILLTEKDLQGNKPQKLRIERGGEEVGVFVKGSIIGVRCHLENKYPTVKIFAESLTVIKGI